MIFNLCTLCEKKNVNAYNLLNHSLSEQRAPKGFKDRLLRLFGDISLLLATAIHPQFRTPVVLRLKKTLAETVKSTLISEMKSLMEAYSQSSESNNDNHNEQDFVKVQLVFKRMSNPVKRFHFYIKNIALSDLLSRDFVANLSILSAHFYFDGGEAHLKSVICCIHIGLI